jgi:hypothetical protein
LSQKNLQGSASWGTTYSIGDTAFGGVIFWLETAWLLHQATKALEAEIAYRQYPPPFQKFGTFGKVVK